MMAYGMIGQEYSNIFFLFSVYHHLELSSILCTIHFYSIVKQGYLQSPIIRRRRPPVRVGTISIRK